VTRATGCLASHADARPAIVRRDDTADIFSPNKHGEGYNV
jgi:hypothetical protein